MIYTPLTKKAMKLIYEKHMNQYDKSNLPYVFHPLLVASQMDDENTTLTALLHDIVEDTDITFDDLKAEGFPDEVICALKLLTHNNNVDYYKYVENLSDNDIARKVKMCDLKHNMDLSRLDEITPKDIKRYEKYNSCYNYLEKIEKQKNGSYEKKQ